MKQKIIDVIKKRLQRRIEDAQLAIDNTQASANEEVKSSAGDKYETGRAMGQLDIEMYTRQLHAAMSDLAILENINTDINQSDEIKLGTIVKTSMGVYFLSVGIGKIEIDSEVVFAISVESPIGEVLFLKKKEEAVKFRGKEIKIIEIT